MKKLLILLLLAASACWAQSGIGGGGAGGGVTSSIFYAASSCSGLSNCVQWVDDDATDNCTTATTTWLNSVNAYAGPGTANVTIQGSGSGKAYKFVSCPLTFTGPAGTAGNAQGVSIQSSATIDCAQASGDCISLGKVGCTGFAGYTTGCHDITWRGGTFVGGASNSPAMIEFQASMFLAVLDDATFINTVAGNATLGNCTNYSVQFDTSIGGIEFSRNKYYGTVLGQCFSNNIDTTGGANTIQMRGNMISHTVSAACGSQAHYDSSSHSTFQGNLIFGFAANLTLANNGTGNGGEGGWMVQGNNFDTGGCTVAGGTAAEIQFGGTVNNAVGPANIIGNDFFTAPAIGQTKGSTATMQEWAVSGNTNKNGVIGSNAVLAAAYVCLPEASGADQTPCLVSGNQGFLSYPQFGTNNPTPGWMIGAGNYGRYVATAQAANIGSTSINGGQLVVGTDAIISCNVVVTQQATTSATVPSCSIIWTDAISGVSETQVIAAGGNGGTNPAVGTVTQGTVFASVKANTGINFSTGSYASVGATPMQYAVIVNTVKVF